MNSECVCVCKSVGWRFGGERMAGEGACWYSRWKRTPEGGGGQEIVFEGGGFQKIGLRESARFCF